MDTGDAVARSCVSRGEDADSGAGARAIGGMGAMTAGLVGDAYRDYQLELNETEVVLIVVDRLRRKKSTQMVLLDDIKYAEYYPYSDSASVILHSPYIARKCPCGLWGAALRM